MTNWLNALAVNVRMKQSPHKCLDLPECSDAEKMGGHHRSLATHGLT